MPNYIDIACNFTHQAFNNNILQIIEESEYLGIKHFVVTCSSVHDFKRIQEIKAMFKEKIIFMAGIHPHCAKELHEINKLEFKQTILKLKPNAIGETGLDFNRNFSSQADQLSSFTFHLKLAQEFELPLYLHQRDAHDIFLDHLKDAQSVQKNPFVVHCFTGNKKELKDYLDLDGFIGITGWICDYNRNQELLDSIRYVPLDKIMIETDCPYLLPKNLKPKPTKNFNHPRYLPHIVKEIGLIRGESEELIAHHAYENSLKFFNLT
ncbi:MAG: TatD family hydrolase [Gammaproteobacteria bacterium]